MTTINTAPRELPLPIKLVITPVDLHDRDETANRWTLGPDWYNRHADDFVDTPIRPYYEPRDHSGRDIPAREATNLDTNMGEIHLWAETVISQTSDMTVTGWADPRTPTLATTKYMIDIQTVDRNHFRFAVNRIVAENMERMINDQDNVMRLFSEHRKSWLRRLALRAIHGVKWPNYSTQSTVTIPIRSVVSIRLTSVAMDVENR